MGGTRNTQRRALIVLVVCFVALSAAASWLTVRMHNASDLLAASPVGPADNAVIFVLDGVRPADLSAARTPVVDDLTRRGVSYRNAWLGQLESGGATSNATIATGLFPRRHGVLGQQWRDPRSSHVLHPSIPGQVQLGSLDQVMESKDTTPLAALLKDRGAKSHILSAGGVGCASANAAGSWVADYVICPVRQGSRWTPGSVTGHALPTSVVASLNLSWPVRSGRDAAPGMPGWGIGEQDYWLTRYTLQAMRRVHPRLTIVNFPEVASVSPFLGARDRAAAVRRIVEGIDRDIGRIVTEVRRERIANRTLFVVTSDGGVADLTTRLSAATLHKAVIAAGGQQTYIDPGQTTMLGLRGDLQAQPVALAIQSQRPRGLDGLYYKSRTRDSWKYEAQYLDPDLSPAFSSAMQYELGTMTSDASADLVAVGSPGVGTVPGGRGVNASTLGAQWDVQHIPLILAGHGISPGVVSNYPARLVDVAPTVAAVMGLARPPTDGLVLADGLLQPPDHAKDAQAAEQPQQQKLVGALKVRLAQQAS
jgi:arylsulfatase A-like enzyme